MTAELAAELARNGRRTLVDPRSVPARFHNLKAMGQSPAHCFQSFQDDKWDSLALRIGKGTHAMMFGQPIAVWDQPAAKGTGKAPRNGKVWDAFRATNAHATILSRKEHDKASRIVTSLKAHQVAADLLFAPGVLHESTIMWEQSGRKRRSTPDARGEAHLVELKTARCVHPERFRRDGLFRAYHAQLADQAEAIEYATGSRPWAVYIVAVETVEPYVVQVMQLTQRALDDGARLCRAWLAQLLQCERDNDWPGYSQVIREFDLSDSEVELSFESDETEEEE